MEILLTLPGPFADYVRNHPGLYPEISGVYSDPEPRKLGSGGGSVHVLWEHFRLHHTTTDRRSLQSWLGSGRRMIIHSGGQSRRLPAYAPQGKGFLPFPVYKWSRGQRIDQVLFDTQRPVLEALLKSAPEGLNTMIVSGDAMVFNDDRLPAIPFADVACVGIWSSPGTASRHGVFVCSRNDPSRLNYMLQKPSAEVIQSLDSDQVYLLDAGVWLLSDKAVMELFAMGGYDFQHSNFPAEIKTFDLYTGFGTRLTDRSDGQEDLSGRVIVLPNAGFFHFGSNADLLSSTTALHNRVTDQRDIWHRRVKPSPDIFIQNSVTRLNLQTDNRSIWIDNSHLGEGWHIHSHSVLTGIPENSWHVEVPEGICLDFVPVGRNHWCIRFYGFYDTFSGIFPHPATMFMNQPVNKWFDDRCLEISSAHFPSGKDIYQVPLFPVFRIEQITGDLLQWLINRQPDGGTAGVDARAGEEFRQMYLSAQRLSSEELVVHVNHERRLRQLKQNILAALPALAENFRFSVFYQLDLKRVANYYKTHKITLHSEVPADSSLLIRIHDSMFRSVVVKDISQSKASENKAFALLSEGMTEEVKSHRQFPRLNLQPDQILWGRSPVRLDLAGGWTDTPPYCILHGGSVVNMAVELNGQPPLQVFIRPCSRFEIVVHSIDLGVSEVIRSYQELKSGAKVGSAFAIPRAALMLAGFHPDFAMTSFRSLHEQLKAFGCGFEITLMVAVPKGSGLGTSSILASTLLGTLSDFCRLNWDLHEIANRTLLLEQILTTGGGWQDQYGGIFEGLKMVESMPGFFQRPTVHWASDQLLRSVRAQEEILLYYTGINRVAKHILQDIVKGMFLNSAAHLDILSEMKHHARYTFERCRDHDWNGLAAAIQHSWELNKALDCGTSPPVIESILEKIKDYMIGGKLLGAGGGGYLMLFAKDAHAAGLIRKKLTDNPPNPAARFVHWELSQTGLRISRS